MAEDPNEDSWLYGGPPNANDDDAAQQGIADANEEGIAKVDDATAEEDKLNDVIQAPKDALHGSEEDDVFKEDGHFARNADRPDDDAFEDEEAVSGTHHKALRNIVECEVIVVCVCL